MLQRWDGTKRPYLKTLWENVCRIAAPRRLVLHATSEEEARESERRLPGVETVIVPNGVEIPQTLAQRNGHHERRFAYLGRLHPKKGIENLLDAYKKVQGSLGGTTSLVIAGEGDPPYVQGIRNRIQELGLSETVRMVGHVAGDAKREFLENADVLIAPSHTENFGLVVSEALAHGVPVIASRGTPWSRVEEIGCGLWVDNDPESLASAMQRISSMPLREMGIRGREWMQREFSWDSLAAKMTDVYRNLLQTHEPS
jgi:glycosyltransferase involved in cell wall biosynthesis